MQFEIIREHFGFPSIPADKSFLVIFSLKINVPFNMIWQLGPFDYGNDIQPFRINLIKYSSSK